MKLENAVIEVDLKEEINTDLQNAESNNNERNEKIEIFEGNNLIMNLKRKAEEFSQVEELKGEEIIRKIQKIE